jgi:hypothetical protein
MSVGIVVVNESLLTVKVHVIFVIFVAVFILAYQGTQLDIILPEDKKYFEYPRSYFKFYFVIKISTDYLIYLNSLYRVPVIPPFVLIILNSVFNLSNASNFDILYSHNYHLSLLNAPHVPYTAVSAVLRKFRHELHELSRTRKFQGR